RLQRSVAPWPMRATFAVRRPRTAEGPKPCPPISTVPVLTNFILSFHCLSLGAGGTGAIEREVQPAQKPSTRMLTKILKIQGLRISDLTVPASWGQAEVCAAKRSRAREHENQAACATGRYC